jgi:membrane-associated phospholipid phosphatase
LALLGRPLPGFGGRRLGAIWITLVGVVGVLGNLVFKNGFGRPRPKDTEAFGGAWPFHPPWLPGGACPHNCSFPSGDVGFAFITLAFALAVPAGRGRTVAVAAALAFGGFVAAMRVLTGDHYPSDAAFGALMTSLAVLAFERWWVAPVAKSRSNRHRGVTGMS